MFNRRALVASVAVCLVSVTLATALHGQSLIGDLAAAEAKRRAVIAATPEGKRQAAALAKEQQAAAVAAGAEPAKSTVPQSNVYTDKSAPTANAGASAPPASTPAASGVASTPGAQENPKQPVKGEAYWRGRVAPVRQRMVDNLAKAEFLRRRILALTIELSGIGPLNARRGGVETERQRLITDAEALDAVVSGDVAVFNAIEEEGRVAGALPGWFR